MLRVEAKRVKVATASLFAVSGLVASGSPAQALSFNLLLNYDDASFNAQKTSSSTTVAGTGPLFEEKWVAEARSGDQNGRTTTQSEVSINQWFSNPSGSVVQPPALIGI